MTEHEVLEELKKISEDEARHHRVVKTSRNYEEVEYSKARLEYYKNRRAFLNEKLQALRLQRGIFRTR